MAQFNHKLNLKEASFPLISDKMGRTVLVSNNKQSATAEADNKPSILYCHNVMPTLEGVVSVGFKEDMAFIGAGGIGVPITNMDDVRLVLTDLGARYYLGLPLAGEYYTQITGGDEFIKSSVSIGDIQTTVADVNSTSYIFARAGAGTAVVWQYQTIFSSLQSLALIGSPIADIRGIVGSNGYLIVWGLRADIAWSSTINPLDLTPSAITGAGTGSVAGLKGNIQFCVPIATGFLIYSRENVVAATYTGNIQFPFKFRPVDNSRGAQNLDLVTYEFNTAKHFAYTQAGFQVISNKDAVTTLPEVTDFLAGGRVEDFDETTKLFSIVETAVNVNMKKKINLISSRYLVISYGITEFTHALIYDIVLKKIGKIRFTHVDVFELGIYEVAGLDREFSKESIAFITKTGAVSRLQFAEPFAIRTGALILGKIQYIRDRHLILHRVIAENVNTADTLTLTDLLSVDGRSTSLVVPTETIDTNFRTYYFKSSGKNHSLAFVGKFDFNTIELLFSLGGRR